MTASVIPGHRTWSLTRDGEGHRVYKVTHRVQCDPGDGPAVVLAAFGLPQVGDPWRFGRDLDEWAWCHVDVAVTPVLAAEGPDFFFDVEHTFSTLPPQRPQQPVGDPLLQAPKISGSFTKTAEEVVYDRFGRFLGNSAWEQLRGKQVEFDTGILGLHIEQNLPFLSVGALAACYQAVNASPLWGMPPRTIKLANASWTQNYYTRPGIPPQQGVYYTRTLEFEVNYRGWDRDLLDESNKVLYGRWKSAVTTTTTTTTTPAGTTTTTTTTTGQGTTTTTAPPLPVADPAMWELLPIDSNGAMPDPNNPMHFIRATDRLGNPHRIILNGRGVPAGTVVPLGTLFLCISDADDNTNKPLNNTKVWIPVINPGITDPTTIDTTIIPPWNDGVAYRRGNLVTNAFGDYFVALQASTGVLPSDLGVVEHPEIWFKLPVVPANRGLYDPTINYVLSDYVQAITTQKAGILHIELHPEVDFVFMLGVPEIL